MGLSGYKLLAMLWEPIIYFIFTTSSEFAVNKSSTANIPLMACHMRCNATLSGLQQTSH